jgi:hypothetical protein
MANKFDTAFNLGDDAMSNQFKVTFEGGIPGATNSTENVQLRLDQTLVIPARTFAQYEFFFRGLKITKMSRLEESAKEISMEVRVDQQWKVYDDIQNWHRLVFDDRNATAASEAETRRTIRVDSIDGEDKIAKSFFIRSAKLKEIGDITFDQNSGDPIRMNLTFIFGNIDNGVEGA